MKNIQILIIGFEKTGIENLEHQIKAGGYQQVESVLPAGVGDIESIISGFNPDLLFFDPPSGINSDVLAQAGSIRERFRIPIIFLIDPADEKRIKEMRSVDPCGFITKPVRDIEVGITIELALYKCEMDKNLRDNQRMLSTILHSMGDAVIAADADGKITFMNTLAEELTQWKQVDGVGKDLTDVFRCIKEENSKIQSSTLRRISGQKGVIHRSNTLDLERRDGSKIPITESVSAIEDENGDLIGIVTVFSDISGPKLAEEAKALKKSEMHFRSFFENSTIGLYRTTPDGQVLMVNQALINMLGCNDFEELTCRNLEVDGFEPNYNRAEFRQLIDTNNFIKGREAIWSTKAGEELYLRENAVAIRDKTGRVKYYEGTLENITDRKIAEKALKESHEQLALSHDELIQAYDHTLLGWVHALDLRDKETEGHTQRVTELTLKLALAMDFPEKDLAELKRGALLHDIGKIGIPDSILHKPGPLNDDEWVIMRMHPVYAHQMLSPIPYLHSSVDIPYYHHEKWNGSGYPRGLDQDNIPLSARIFAIVDVWDALNSDRPYRSKWPRNKVIDYIQSESETHFDKTILEEFLKMILV